MRVCVVTAMRDASAYLPSFFRMVEGLRPACAAVVENDSTDGTATHLAAWRPDFPVATRFVLTEQGPFPRDRSEDRKAHLADMRNRAIAEALRMRGWDWALMHDVRKWSPRALLQRLSEVPGDVRAPMILRPDNVFYDTWCFLEANGTPIAKLRYEISSTPFYRPMMSVGGVLLVSREMLERGCRYGGAPAHGCDSAGMCAGVVARGGGVVMATHVASIACEPDEFRRRELFAWEAEEARAR